MTTARSRFQPLSLAAVTFGVLALAALPQPSARVEARPAGPPIVVGNDGMPQTVRLAPGDAAPQALRVDGPVRVRAAAPARPQQACEPDAADRLKGEGFEDVRFPRRGDKWRTFDAGASLPGQNDVVKWGRVTCQNLLGLASLWSVGAGSVGGSQKCDSAPFTYPSDQSIHTELQYVTFDLSNYDYGMRVTFDYMAKMPARALYVGAGDWSTRATSGLQVFGTGEFQPDTGGQWVRGQVVKLQQDTIKKKKEVLLTFIYADPPPNADGSPGTGKATPGMYGVFIDNVWIDGLISPNPCFIPTETPRPIITSTPTRTPSPTEEEPATDTPEPITDTPVVPPTRMTPTEEPTETPYIPPTRPPTRTPEPSDTPYVPPTRPPTSTPGGVGPTDTPYVPPTPPPTRTPGGVPTETPYVPPTRPATRTPRPTDTPEPTETPYVPPTRPPTRTPEPTETPYVPPTRPPTSTPGQNLPTDTPYVPPTRPPTRTPRPTDTPYVPPTRPPTRTPDITKIKRIFLPLAAMSLDRDRDIHVVPTAPTASRTPLPSATFTAAPPTNTRPPTATNTRVPTKTRRPVDTDTPTPPPTPTYTPVPIPEIILDFLQPYTLGSELEIARVRNIGTGPQDMSGWRVYALKKSKSCSFPAGLKLGPDETYEFQTGRDAQDVPGKAQKCDNSFIWDNNEDKAELYNRINVKVDTWCYERLGGRYPCP